MNELPAVWLGDPAEDGADPYLIFELQDPLIFSVSRDMLVMPIVVLERNGEEVDRQLAMLMQYSGDKLMRTLALSGEFEPGTRWLLERGLDDQPTISQLATDDSN